jgi:GTPase SAR1 family protein
VDTAGAEEFKEVRDQSISERDSYILVYDVGNLDSFTKLDSLI